jgi:hypothetical protein
MKKNIFQTNTIKKNNSQINTVVQYMKVIYAQLGVLHM